MLLTSLDIPQADMLWDVARVPEAIARGHRDPEAIAAYIGAKVARQGKYYIQAARILGLVEANDQVEQARLTPLGRAFASYHVSDQRMTLRRLMFHREPTRSVLLAIREQAGLDVEGVAVVLQALAPLAPSTANRRARTIIRWLETTGLLLRDGDQVRYCGPDWPLAA